MDTVDRKMANKVVAKQANYTNVNKATSDTVAAVDLTIKTVDIAPNVVQVETVNSKDNTVLQSEAESKKTKKNNGVHMKDQLLYLANLLGFEVTF